MSVEVKDGISVLRSSNGNAIKFRGSESAPVLFGTSLIGCDQVSERVAGVTRGRSVRRIESVVVDFSAFDPGGYIPVPLAGLDLSTSSVVVHGVSALVIDPVEFAFGEVLDSWAVATHEGSPTDLVADTLGAPRIAVGEVITSVLSAPVATIHTDGVIARILFRDELDAALFGILSGRFVVTVDYSYVVYPSEISDAGNFGANATIECVSSAVPALEAVLNIWRSPDVTPPVWERLADAISDDEEGLVFLSISRDFLYAATNDGIAVGEEEDFEVFFSSPDGADVTVTIEVSPA